jgi:hypothetical protein
MEFWEFAKAGAGAGIWEGNAEVCGGGNADTDEGNAEDAGFALGKADDCCADGKAD